MMNLKKNKKDDQLQEMDLLLNKRHLLDDEVHDFICNTKWIMNFILYVWVTLIGLGLGFVVGSLIFLIFF